ncbi:Glycosyltransferase involved in cell wall bisynthesis [Chitinophaga costaii]|uniref:Glycosyltransferase involved in cell wall bisynthesis n=1 Tax=Chitinophaga costaii TaxID=1335309 RepID=A0A1C3ZAR4_9BACT|nr:glycosyltransferase family 1 protein [Chitinophaga costaii]PUZ30298.1 glycosyltransferase family 1 protein [Chitinophaga costaii]SCB79474.1 Glycosyltransferase involved in cell wall bisynthesis [Chitinophaga costaii]
MKKVLIDFSACILRRGQSFLPGIGRSTLELVKALAQDAAQPPALQLYTQFIRSRLPQPAAYAALPMLHIPLPGTPAVKNLVTQLSVKERLTGYDLLHIPHNYDTVKAPDKTVLTIHDTFCFTHPQYTDDAEAAQRRLRAAAGACRGIATCSYASQADIILHLKVPADKVSVIPWGISREIFYQQAEAQTTAALQPFHIQRPYFLSTSCGTGRKNTIAVIEAYRLLRKQGVYASLVLLWDQVPPTLLHTYAQDILRGDLHILPAVNDDVLRALYCGAIATVFLSHTEGFGFVPLESMACGTPVILTRQGALPETGGPAALYAASDMPEEVAALMQGILQHPERFNTSLATAHLQQFNWHNTAAAYRSFYTRWLQLQS